MSNKTPALAVAGRLDRQVMPRAWLCELAEEDGTTRTQFVEEDPSGLRWNDAGAPSPYRVTPLLTLAQADAMVAAERERCAKLCADMGAATWWPNEARDMADLLRKRIFGGPNVEFSGVPAGHSSNHPAGGTSAETKG